MSHYYCILLKCLEVVPLSLYFNFIDNRIDHQIDNRIAWRTSDCHGRKDAYIQSMVNWAAAPSCSTRPSPKRRIDDGSIKEWSRIQSGPTLVSSHTCCYKTRTWWGKIMRTLAYVQTQLECLDMSSTQVTTDGIVEFKQIQPNCRIIAFYWMHSFNTYVLFITISLYWLYDTLWYKIKKI